MKKNYLYSAAVVATLALASCSSSDVIDVTDGAQASGQVLEIAVENAGNGLESRSGRPLYSSEAAQDIDNVKVVVVETNGENKKVVAEELITDWMNSNKVINYDDASGHGRKIRIELTGDNAFTKENGATYKVYAIGYSDDTNYKVGTSSLGAYLNGITKTSTTDLENLALINQGEDKNKAEEIFAGSADITFSSATSGSSKFSQGVTLHRQVAGVFTYVKNIPCVFNNEKVIGTKLQLVASTTNQNLILGNFYDKTLAENGKNNKLLNVVNGTSSRGGSEQVIYTIDLKNWFTTLQDVNNDGFLDRYEYKQDGSGKLVEDTGDGKQIWKNPFRKEDGTAPATFVKGSVFGGEFIIPFMKTDKSTFELRLVDDNGTPVKHWSISLPESDRVSGANLSYWNNAWTTTAGDYADEKDKYSVLRNHLYGVGIKTSANPDTNDPEGPTDDPENPTPGTDDPQDLNTKQDIMLQVNDNWEVIHQMVVE